jgi:flagellar export protein FliJ
MAYRFRFQALLKYRQYLLTQAQTELATTMRNHEAAQERFERTIAERDKNLALFQEKKRSGIKASEYNLFHGYFVSLEQQLLYLEMEVQELSRDVEEAKKVLILRERELKMLEITDTKDRSAFRKAERKKEQIRLDERAIIGDFRKRIEP